MKRWPLFAAFVAVLPVIALACGDDDAGNNINPTPAPTTSATTVAPTIDAAAPDATAAARRTGCLDRPTDLDRPDRLPCNLIPPGLTL